MPGSTRNLNDVPPHAAMLTARIIWGGLLMGQIFFFCVLLVILHQPPAKPAPDPEILPVLFLVNAIMLITIPTAMFFVRNAIFRRSMVNGMLPPAAYSTGNIIFWAGCEAVSFFAMVIMMIGHSVTPTVYIAAVAFALQVFTMPRRATFDSWSHPTMAP